MSFGMSLGYTVTLGSTNSSSTIGYQVLRRDEPKEKDQGSGGKTGPRWPR